MIDTLKFYVFDCMDMKGLLDDISISNRYRVVGTYKKYCKVTQHYNNVNPASNWTMFIVNVQKFVRQSGDNCSLSTWLDLYKCFMMLYSWCPDVLNAQLSRIDIACSVSVENPAGEYLRLLECPSKWRCKEYYNAQHLMTGLSFYTESKAFCGYDKILEIKSHSGIVPALYKNKNVVRIEYRLYTSKAIKEVLQQFDNPKSLCLLVFDIERYKRLIQVFRDEFRELKKNNGSVCLNKNVNYTSDMIYKALSLYALEESPELKTQLKAFSKDFISVDTAMKNLQTFKKNHAKVWVKSNNLTTELEDKILNCSEIDFLILEYYHQDTNEMQKLIDIMTASQKQIDYDLLELLEEQEELKEVEKLDNSDEADYIA